MLVLFSSVWFVACWLLADLCDSCAHKHAEQFAEKCAHKCAEKCAQKCAKKYFQKRRQKYSPGLDQTGRSMVCVSPEPMSATLIFCSSPKPSFRRMDLIFLVHILARSLAPFFGTMFGALIGALSGAIFGAVSDRVVFHDRETCLLKLLYMLIRA